MEDIALRFPHLGEAIFDQVDDKTLINCRKMSKVWCSIIDGQRNTWLRLLKKYVGNFDNQDDIVEQIYALHESDKTPDQKKEEVLLISKEGVYRGAWKRAVEKMPFEMLKELVLKVKYFHFKRQFQKFGDTTYETCVQPLHYAAITGNLMMYKFISEKMEYNCQSFPSWCLFSPANYAARYGNMEVLKFITENYDNSLKFITEDDGIPLDDPIPLIDLSTKTGITPLHTAAIGGHFEIYKYLAEKVVDKNPGKKGRMTHGVTPLHSAAAGGHLQMCQYILENVSEKNPRNWKGETPLHCAALNGHLAVYKLIAEQLDQCDRNPARTNGGTPLHNAAKEGHLSIVKYILAQVDNKNPKREFRLSSLHSQDWKNQNLTPLHAAAFYGRYEVYKYIGDNVEDKNPCDRNGWTPLHSSASVGNFAICEYILAHLKDKSSILKSNPSPLKIASDAENFEIVELIQSAIDEDKDVKV